MSDYSNDNVFAKILRGEIPAEKVFEDDHAIVIMDLMPQTRGHCLVIPKAASRNLLDADDAALAGVIPLVKKVARAAKSAYSADGVRIAQFNETAAGQTVFHLHFHILPVYDGVPVKAHSGETADKAELARLAEMLRGALEAGA